MQRSTLRLDLSAGPGRRVAARGEPSSQGWPGGVSGDGLQSMAACKALRLAATGASRRLVQENLCRAGRRDANGNEAASRIRTGRAAGPGSARGEPLGYGSRLPLLPSHSGILSDVVAHNGTSGVATAAEVDVDTLEERLRAEVRALGTVALTPPLVGAWARKA